MKKDLVMKSIAYKIGRITGFSAACMVFFHMLFFILAYSKKIDFKLSNYFIILAASLFILTAYSIYRIFKK
jgi:hypothetical protein